VERRLNYVLLDTSVNMIVSTLRDLDRFGHGAYVDFADPIPLSGDFMDLATVEQHVSEHGLQIREGNRRVAYFFPGGTISNIEEDDFIASVGKVAQPRDVLIIGVEFTPEDADFESYRAHLKKKYNNDALRDFFIPIVRSILDELRPYSADKTRIDTMTNRDVSALIHVDVQQHERPTKLFMGPAQSLRQALRTWKVQRGQAEQERAFLRDVTARSIASGNVGEVSAETIIAEGRALLAARRSAEIAKT
jgi:hypothetical protein